MSRSCCSIDRYPHSAHVRLPRISNGDVLGTNPMVRRVSVSCLPTLVLTLTVMHIQRRTQYTDDEPPTAHATSIGTPRSVYPRSVGVINDAPGMSPRCTMLAIRS